MSDQDSPAVRAYRIIEAAINADHADAELNGTAFAVALVMLFGKLCTGDSGNPQMMAGLLNPVLHAAGVAWHFAPLQ